MAERIFDVTDTVPTPTPIAYDLDPSPLIHSIRNVIVKRYADKKRRLSTAKFDHRPLKKKHVQIQSELVGNGGLPSPPVDSPVSEFPGDDHDDEALPSVTTTTQLTAGDIVKKLDELKEEKHRLFQLIKRLMQQEQEEEHQQQQQQAEAPPPPVAIDNKPNSSPWSVNENDTAASSTPPPPPPPPSSLPLAPRPPPALPTAPVYRPPSSMPPPPNDHFRRPPAYGRPFNNNNKRPYSSNSSRPLSMPPPHPPMHAPRYFQRQRPMYRPSYSPREYAPQPWSSSSSSSSPVQP